jgi:hypothetical protein
MINIKFLLSAFVFCLFWQLLSGESSAALKCSRLFKTAGGEQLINSCNSCRIIKVQRKRPGAGGPINRTFTVPPKTTTNLSFRGPGRSRVVSDAPCHEGSVGKKGNEANKSPGKVVKRCILMQRIEKAGITGLALANTCVECRMAVVDRVDAAGSRRSQNIAISGKSIIPLPAMGAAHAGVMSEKSCK